MNPKIASVPAAGLLIALLAAPSHAGNTPTAPAQNDAAPMSLENAAMEGDPMALFVAARRHLIVAANRGSDSERKKGLDYLNRALEAGFTPAAYFAGSIYLTGDIVEQNIPQAVHWFERAAEAGDPGAQLTLANLLASGEQVEQDIPAAVHWYETVLANPDAGYESERLWEVSFTLGTLYAEGLGVPADPVRARELWKDAAELGAYPPARKALADAWATGLGGPRDVDTAMRHYYSAATGYFTSAVRHNLGHHTVQQAEQEILQAMESLAPDSRLIHKLKEELTTSHTASL
ncbi:MAG: tetratricopeptide repeat protein [Leptospirillia bacterium]